MHWTKYLLAGIFMMGAACGGGGSAEVTPTPTGSVNATGGIVDQNGQALAQIGATDPVRLQLSGLAANTQYAIHVTGPGGAALSPSEGFIATTDEDGNIPTATVVQDLGSTGSGSGKSMALWKHGFMPQTKADPGDYEIALVDDAGDTIFTDTFTVVDGNKVYCTDASKVARGSFLPSETVYATIERGTSGNLADGSYTCYVRDDLFDTLADGDVLAGPQHVVAVSGGSGVVSLGTYDTGAYDVVCDLNANNQFDVASDVIARPGRFHACFTIQNANTGDAIVGQICADRNGNYRDVFDPNATDTAIRDVFAWISPSQRSLVQHATGVRKYVTAHRNSWSDGDALNDVTGVSGDSAFELDAVQAFCTNEAPWLVWPRQRLSAGCYDCVVDVNANGVFDFGTDFVDNLDSTGENTTCGMRVADTACPSDFVTVSSHQSGDSVNATAIILSGTFAGAVADGSVIITAEAQSNRVALALTGGDFSAAIPLFHGKNLLTINGLQPNGLVCSKTIDVTSEATASANQLFRAQMTWDGDTDMDLHLVKAGGSYSNGGGGTTDCNYSNCKVGLDGAEGTGDAGENHSIDWGTASVLTDDPFLDVDCIACGNGIENIWMNQINEDGDYQLYVDAYSGSESAVNVTIFIRGATVETVACGALSAGTPTDSCLVGTIRWTGGTNGSGYFIASGTKANDF